MAEDAKAAKNRRLAEALRANLKRRKAVAATQRDTSSHGEAAASRRSPADKAAGGEGGTD